MYAIKENKEYRIEEKEKAAFLAEGYSIYNDDFDLVEQPDRDTSSEDLEKIKAENKKLKAENTKLKNKLKNIDGGSGGRTDGETEGQ